MQSGELQRSDADLGWITPCTNLTVTHNTSPPGCNCSPGGCRSPVSALWHLQICYTTCSFFPRGATGRPNAQRLDLSPMNYFQERVHHFFMIVHLLCTGCFDILEVLLLISYILAQESKIKAATWPLSKQEPSLTPFLPVQSCIPALMPSALTSPRDEQGVRLQQWRVGPPGWSLMGPLVLCG